MKIKMVGLCGLLLLLSKGRSATTTTVIGNTITLTVTTAKGDTPFTYQWIKDGNELSGAVDNPHSFVAGAGDAGVYTVRVSNAAGSTLSDAATLTLISQGTIEIVSTIMYASMPSGYTATYQWLKENKTVQAGGTSYSFSDVTPHTYQVIVTWHKLSPLK